MNISEFAEMIWNIHSDNDSDLWKNLKEENKKLIIGFLRPILNKAFNSVCPKRNLEIACNPFQEGYNTGFNDCKDFLDKNVQNFMQESEGKVEN